MWLTMQSRWFRVNLQYYTGHGNDACKTYIINQVPSRAGQAHKHWARLKVCRLRECCKQGQAEMVSISRIKIHLIWSHLLAEPCNCIVAGMRHCTGINFNASYAWPSGWLLQALAKEREPSLVNCTTPQQISCAWACQFDRQQATVAGNANTGIFVLHRSVCIWSNFVTQCELLQLPQIHVWVLDAFPGLDGWIWETAHFLSGGRCLLQWSPLPFPPPPRWF